MIAGIELCPMQLNAKIDSIIDTNNGYIFRRSKTMISDWDIMVFWFAQNKYIDKNLLAI